MKVLVTGHNGYMGSVMTSLLIMAGHAVTGLDTYYYENGLANSLSKGIPTSRKDVRDIQENDLLGYDAVIHLAGLSYDRLGELDRQLTHEINYKASVRLAKMAREAGVKRFLFASSCSVYGSSRDTTLTEDAPLKPLSPYAESKARAEEGISKLAAADFSPVLMRSATAYGYSPNFRTDLVLNNLAGWASLTGRIRFRSDGTAWRPVAHVEDISRAFVAVLDAPSSCIHGQVFNVGVNGENYQVRQLAAIVRDVVPGCVVEYARDCDSDPRNYRVDFSKLHREVGSYCPSWNAQLGAEELYQFYQRCGMPIEHFEGPLFVRLKRLEQLRDAQELDSALRWRNQEAQSRGLDGE